jgi:CHASE3 domain sensor protein
MRFSTRLYAAFALSAVFTFAVGAFAMVQMSTMGTHAREISALWMPTVRALGDIKSDMREFRTQELQHLLSHDAAEREHREAKMTDTLAKIDQGFARIGSLIRDDAERRQFDELKRVQAERIAAHMKVRTLSREGRHEDALALARGRGLEASRRHGRKDRAAGRDQRAGGGRRDRRFTGGTGDRALGDADRRAAGRDGRRHPVAACWCARRCVRWAATRRRPWRSSTASPKAILPPPSRCPRARSTACSRPWIACASI